MPRELSLRTNWKLLRFPQLNTMSIDFLDRQREAQLELKCDYCFIVYDKDKHAPPPGPGCPPQYVAVRTVPLKLSHQVFMQLSFNVLKERLRQGRDVRRQRTAKDACHGEDEFHADIIAMFQFLVHYSTQLSRAALNRPIPTATAVKKIPSGTPKRIQGTTSRSLSTSTVSSTSSSEVVPLKDSEMIASKQHIRFQLLLEYGVDVMPLLKDMKSGSLQKHVHDRLIPKEVSEEEFYAQMGRPSGMAQTCAIC